MRKSVLAFVTLVLSGSVSAALIDNGIYTTDTVSGLDWLDLSVTSDQSYNSAEANNPGWRLATNAEVENIFNVMFIGYSDTDDRGWSHSSQGAYSNQYADIIDFNDLISLTDESVEGRYISYGLYEDEDGLLRLLGTLINLSFDPDLHVVYGTNFNGEYEIYRTEGYSIAGVYMVRTEVVPVPPAVWLFGSGLLGLIGLARRKLN